MCFAVARNQQGEVDAMAMARNTGGFANLATLAREDPDFVKQAYGRIELHPGLPKGKRWLLKWEGNAARIKPTRNEVRERAETQGSELCVQLEEFAHLPICGIRFMACIEVGNSNVNVTNAEELNAMAAESHRAGFLFLVGQTMKFGLPERDLNKRPVKDRRRAAERQAKAEVLFATALREGHVDYDAYISSFPGTLDGCDAQMLGEDRELAEYEAELGAATHGRLMLMACESDTDTMSRRAETASAVQHAVGTISGPATWGMSFWEVDWEELLDAKGSPEMAALTALERFRVDLSTGGAKTRHNDRRRAITTPYWDALGIPKEQVEAASYMDSHNSEASAFTTMPVRPSLNHLSNPGSGADLWKSYDAARRQLISELFGPTGTTHAVSSDHELGYFLRDGLHAAAIGPALWLTECHLSVFIGMADYVDTFLFHPATMAVRYEHGR